MAGKYESKKSGRSGARAILGVALASIVSAVGCANEDAQRTSLPLGSSGRTTPFVAPIRPADILTTSGRSRMVELEASFSRPSDPGLGVAPIRPRDAGLVAVKRNGQVPLGAFAPPGTRVIFRTTDGGKFVGGSTIVEVKADQAGLATAVFWATEDARGYVDITAMSPQLSGTATFTVEIKR